VCKQGEKKRKEACFLEENDFIVDDTKRRWRDED
jgi:hypothetical protein